MNFQTNLERISSEYGLYNSYSHNEYVFGGAYISYRRSQNDLREQEYAVNTQMHEISLDVCK